MTKHNIIYLAAPYTHPNAEVRRARFEAITRAAAKQIAAGKIVYSPVTMTHPIDLALAGKGQTLGSDYWVKYDEAFMELCSEMVVLRLEGWEQSSGVRREIDFFKSKNLAVTFIDPDEATT